MKELIKDCLKKSDYRPEIDGLRALAVICVIVNHLDKTLLPGGYLGVDIFFVISGFVITSSLYKRKDKNLKVFITKFYLRRIKRLIPALSFFVFVTSIVICFFNPIPITSLRTGFASLFGLSNLYLAKQSTNYFGQSTEFNAFVHTWSLGVEEQFYILFPILFWFSGFGKKTKNGNRNLFFSMVSLTVASLTGFIYLYPVNQSLAFFLMPTRFWEIAVGSLVFILCKKQSYIEEILKKIPSLIVLLFIIGIMYLPTSWEVTSTLLIVALSSLLIVSLKRNKPVYKLFTNSKVVFLGRISYSLYLWHWGIFSISRWTIGIYWWSIPFQVFILFIVSVFSYQCIEKPIRRIKESKNIFIYLKGLGLFIFVSSCSYFLSINSALLYSGERPKIESIGTESLKSPLRRSFSGSKWNGKDCWFLSNDSWNFEKIISKCSFGDFKNASNRFIVLGNSYAPSFAAMFDKIASETDYSFLVFVNEKIDESSYKPSGLTENSGASDRFVSGEKFQELIFLLEDGDAVIWVSDFHGFIDISSFYQGEDSVNAFAKGLKHFENRLSKNYIKLIILDALPLARDAFCMPGQAMEQWFNKINYSRCLLPGKQETLDSRSRFHNLAFSELDNLNKIDLYEAFCPKNFCDYFDISSEIMLYRDSASHPSVEGVINSEFLFKKQLMKIIDQN